MAVRRQISIDVNLSLVGAALYVLKPGGRVSGAPIEILPGTSEVVVFSEIGALVFGSQCYHYRGGLLNQAATLEVASIPVFDAQSGSWTAEIRNLSVKKATLDSASSVVLREGFADNYAVVFGDDFYSGALKQPLSCPADGMFRVYVEVYDRVDIIVDPIGPPITLYPRVLTLCPVVHPEDFGAVGDGVIDDRSAIQDAIEFLATQGGGTLELNARTYAVGVSPTPFNVDWYYCLRLRSGVTIRGLDSKSTLKVGAEAGEAILILGSEIDHCCIEHLRLDGNIDHPGVVDIRQGVYLLAASHCTVASCELAGFGRTIGDSAGLGIMVGVLEDLAGDSVGNRIEGNTILDAGGQLNFGIRLYSDFKLNLEEDQYTKLCRDNIVSDNFVLGTAWNSIELLGPATRSNIVISNVLKDVRGPRGFAADKGANGNLFASNIVDGITQIEAVTTAAFCEQGDVPVPGDNYYPTRVAHDNSWVNNAAVNLVQNDVVTGVYGFYCNRSRRVNIVDLHVSGAEFPVGSTTIAGIMVQSEFNDATIKNCVFRDLPVGVTFVDNGMMNNVIISECNIEALHTALWIHRDPVSPKGDFCISNCRLACSSGGQYAVYIGDGQRIVMQGNLVGGGTVLFDESFAGDCVFQGNSVRIEAPGVTPAVGFLSGTVNFAGNFVSSLGLGLLLGPNTQHCIVLGNQLGDNALGPISDQGLANTMGYNIG